MIDCGSIDDSSTLSFSPMFENVSNSNLRGNIGLTYAIAYYSKLGYIVSLPITDSQDYDILIDTETVIKKVQVKTVSFKDKRTGNYAVCLKTNSGFKNNRTFKDFSENSSDILFVLTEEGICYSIPRDRITAKTQLTLNSSLDDCKVTLF